MIPKQLGALLLAIVIVAGALLGMLAGVGTSLLLRLSYGIRAMTVDITLAVVGIITVAGIILRLQPPEQWGDSSVYWAMVAAVGLPALRHILRRVSRANRFGRGGQ